jgi:hypothetical protein
LLIGSSKEDEKISVDDIVRFWTHFSVSRAIKDYVMEAGPLGQPQHPRLEKKEVESATTMLYKWLLKAVSCAVAPSKTTTMLKKWILPGFTMKNLLSMARGFAVHLHLLVNALCHQRK